MAFKALCADILNDQEVQNALRAAARSPLAPGYGGVIKTLAAYAEGLPTQKLEHDVGDRLADLITAGLSR